MVKGTLHLSPITKIVYRKLNPPRRKLRRYRSQDLNVECWRFKKLLATALVSLHLRGVTPRANLPSPFSKGEEASRLLKNCLLSFRSQLEGQVLLSKRNDNICHSEAKRGISSFAQEEISPRSAGAELRRNDRASLGAKREISSSVEKRDFSSRSASAAAGSSK